ncbi:MAG: hypothetical protein CVU12_09650 [Bacteroidetes bacterium HGW-Bacteroidetes-7]|nr:MAG: hypothetical protein CVU12_09650 [Bacteroidetes bacterium HGW-Bacteroidetes-7]
MLKFVFILLAFFRLFSLVFVCFRLFAQKQSLNKKIPENSFFLVNNLQVRQSTKILITHENEPRGKNSQELKFSRGLKFD